MPMYLVDCKPDYPDGFQFILSVQFLLSFNFLFSVLFEFCCCFFHYIQFQCFRAAKVNRAECKSSVMFTAGGLIVNAQNWLIWPVSFILLVLLVNVVEFQLFSTFRFSLVFTNSEMFTDVWNDFHTKRKRNSHDSVWRKCEQVFCWVYSSEGLKCEKDFPQFCHECSTLDPRLKK